jgi:ABC-type lipoprotein release transport system permease subunit
LRRIATVQMGWYLPYELPVAAIVEFVLITLPISALAGLYPAREAARLQVRDALDYE